MDGDRGCGGWGAGARARAGRAGALGGLAGEGGGGGGGGRESGVHGVCADAGKFPWRFHPPIVGYSCSERKALGGEGRVGRRGWERGGGRSK